MGNCPRNEENPRWQRQKRRQRQKQRRKGWAWGGLTSPPIAQCAIGGAPGDDGEPVQWEMEEKGNSRYLRDDNKKANATAKQTGEGGGIAMD